MANGTRRFFMLGLVATGLAMAADAQAKGSRSGRRSGSGHSKGGKGGSGSGSGGAGGGDSSCGSRGGPGGPRDANGKCPGWKK